MKLSWLLRMLLAGLSFTHSIVPEDGGGAGNDGEDGGDGGDGDTGDGEDGDKGGDDKPAGDKPKPTDAEAKLLKEVMDKKNALKREQQEKKELAEKLKAFEGIDPEQVRTLLKEREEAENKKLEDKGDFERLKKKMADEHAAEKTKLLETNQALAAQLKASQDKISELTVGNAFSTSEFIREDLALTPNKARVVYGSHFEFSEDGVIVAYDKPAGAKDRTLIVDASGTPLAFNDALKKLVDADPDRDQLLRSKVKTGADSRSTKDKAPPAKTTEKLSGREKISAALIKSGGIGK